MSDHIFEEKQEVDSKLVLSLCQKGTLIQCHLQLSDNFAVEAGRVVDELINIIIHLFLWDDLRHHQLHDVGIPNLYFLVQYFIVVKNFQAMNNALVELG